jgi:hypothetical protein
MEGAMEMIMCGLSMALGVFVAAFPARTAKLWASEKFDKGTPTNRLWFLRCWRMFGVLLFLAGALAAFDSIVFPGQ